MPFTAAGEFSRFRVTGEGFLGGCDFTCGEGSDGVAAQESEGVSISGVPEICWRSEATLGGRAGKDLSKTAGVELLELFADDFASLAFLRRRAINDS